VFFGTKTIDLYGGGLADLQVAISDFQERFAQRFVFIYEIEEHHQFAAAAAMLIILCFDPQSRMLCPVPSKISGL
jgi:acyl-CoA thioesterase FadM